MELQNDNIKGPDVGIIIIINRPGQVSFESDPQ